jgi:hypothetical protein
MMACSCGLRVGPGPPLEGLLDFGQDATVGGKMIGPARTMM